MARVLPVGTRVAPKSRAGRAKEGRAEPAGSEDRAPREPCCLRFLESSVFPPTLINTSRFLTQRKTAVPNYFSSPLASKSRAQCAWSRMRSPLASVSSLLSSITEFMFSTHKASTSPSNNIYLPGREEVSRGPPRASGGGTWRDPPPAATALHVFPRVL